MHWNATLSKQQEKSFYLFCSIRHAVYEASNTPDNLTISGMFNYRIDGAVDGVPIDGNKASVIAGAKLGDVAKNFPNYDSVNNILTFPIDTILRHRANIWVMNTASVTVEFTDIQTSAMRVYWDVIENKFVTTRFDTVLNSSQKYLILTFLNSLDE